MLETFERLLGRLSGLDGTSLLKSKFFYTRLAPICIGILFSFGVFTRGFRSLFLDEDPLLIPYITTGLIFVVLVLFPSLVLLSME